ncbi:NAD(P)-binding protein [Xylariaceae sp. FL0016]|nr:NAD(P)-binding protein [Xylariaceae sp. FL0016]
MAPKIFLTGATGYIGGQALYTLHKAHPDYEYTIMVRDEERGKLVSAQYPDVKFIYGTNDSSDVISKAAAAADVVVHTADSADNMASARAIASGLAAGHSAAKPGYWIHVCGTGMLMWYDLQEKRFGQASLPEQRYHDIDDIERITSLPHHAPHRDVDEVVLAANDDPAVRTLIVSPPTIYGTGDGPVNQRSMQVPRLAAQVLEEGFAPVQAPGLTEWNHVHIRDLGDFFVLAVDAALDPKLNADPEIFGKKGYHFLESGSHKLSDTAKWIAEEAVGLGLLDKVEVKEVQDPRIGANSQAIAARARKYLGWEPKAKGFREEIVDAVKVEAKKLGKM